MTLRRATPDDAPLLVRLYRHVHDPHVEAEPEVYRSPSDDEALAFYRERLARADVVVFVAEVEGQGVGYVLCQHVRREASAFTRAREYLMVDQLAVAADHRRAGLGRRLMAAAEELARELGLARVELDVRGWNAGARAFYQALGFAPAQLRLGRSGDQAMGT